MFEGHPYIAATLDRYVYTPAPGRGAAMSVQITPHPSWVAELDSTLEPSRQAILDTPVIIDASENQLVDGQIQNFLVGFYPIIRDFPQWLQMLLDRSPPMGREFFTDNIRVERRHDAMWRAMGDGFNVHKKRFQEPEPMIPAVKKFHAYLTEMCRNAEFGQAVSATLARAISKQRRRTAWASLSAPWETHTATPNAARSR